MNVAMIGSNLHRIRKDRQMSQDNLAKLAGVSRIAYRNIESGASIPKVSTLQNISTALQVNLSDLLTPVKILSHVRFRSLKRMNSRESILIDVARWLDDYNYIENLLEEKEEYKFLDFCKDKLCMPVGEERAKFAAKRAREILGLNGSDAIRDIAGLIESSGIKLFPMKLASDGFFGLSVSELDGGPAIIVNVWERISVERWIFTAAHELGHLLLHVDSYDVDQQGENEEQECEANIFASYFLLPEEAFLSAWRESAGLDLVDRVYKTKRIFNVSYKTVLYRISKNNGQEIWPRFNNAYKNKCGSSLKASVEPQGIRPSSFGNCPEVLKAKEPESLSPLYFLEDRLSLLVRRAIDLEKITLGRGAEILGCDLIKMREIAASWV